MTWIRAATLVACTMLVVAGGLASAQPASVGWRLVQSSDGSLHLLTDIARHWIVPDSISDEELAAIPEGVPLVGQLPHPAPQTVVVVATPTPAPSPTPGGTTIIAGKTVDHRGKVLTVLNVERPAAAGQFTKPNAGNEFLRVTVRIDNRRADAFAYNALTFSAQGSDLIIRGASAGSGNLGSGELPSGGSVVGAVVIQMPVGVPMKYLVWTPDYAGAHYYLTLE